MKNLGKQAIGENLLYLLVWAAIILVPVLHSQMMSELHVSLDKAFIAWRQIAPYFVIFIIHNAILAPRYMLRRKYGKYLALDIALILVVFSAVAIYEDHLAERFLTTNDADDDALAAYRRASITNLDIYWNLLLGFFMTGANTGIKLIYQSMRDEQQMEELKRQNLQAEMDYLKYQINPHFFMNTLNNIHALIDIDAECAKSAIIELSKMMRYVLYDSGRERISLNNDILFLKNYIELMRIRYTDTVEIRMEYPHNLPEQVSLPPLLLIVFVENAFKHGVSYNRPSFIHLKLTCDEQRIRFSITNSRHVRSEQRPTGIGLENVRKRLDLLYGEKRYVLDIRPAEESYTVNLEIPIAHA